MWPWRKKPKVEGLIAYYGLTDWWLASFTEGERRLIDERYKPMGEPPHTLTQGQHTSPLPVTEFLNNLTTWFRSRQDSLISERIQNKLAELGRENPILGAGYYKGRHFTTYVNEVKSLKNSGKIEEVEMLLLELVVATEAEDKKDKRGVAPWYYEELAKIYRKQKDYAKEVSILERFSVQRHAAGATPPKLIERLAKAKELLEHSIKKS